MERLKVKKKHKRYFLLLEVMISFALVVLCALPLIYPHTYILRMQREFIQEIELDHYVNNNYAELTEMLYKNQVPWEVISGKRTLPLNPPDIPVTGTLQFEEKKHKPDEAPTYGVYLFEITYTFTNGLKYTYNLMLVRDIPGESIEEKPTDEDED